MKTKVGTLLAVTLATTAPAAAGPEHAHHARPVAAKPTPAEREAAFRAWEAEQDRIDVVLITYGITRPRELRTGAPACGNVQTKSLPDWQERCFTAHAAEARVNKERAARRGKREGNS